MRERRPRKPRQRFVEPSVRLLEIEHRRQLTVAGDLWTSKEQTGVGKEDIKPALFDLTRASATVLTHGFQPTMDRHGDTDLVVAQPRSLDLAHHHMIDVFGDQSP